MALSEAEELELLELEEQEAMAAPAPSFLERAADVSQSVQDVVMPPIAGAIDFVGRTASKGLLHSEKPYDIAMRGLGYVADKIEKGGEYIAGKGGELGYPKTGAVAGMVAANLPYMIPLGKGAQISTKLKPFSGKPGIAARMGQMRTGVEASAFEQLRRDPAAFFQTTARSDVGQAIGAAKEASGISLGVTDDISTLTKKNLSKARNIQTAGTQAENAIVGRIEDVLETGELPIGKAGAKEGAPHALFSYTDDFGPGGTKRNVYNVFGDPKNPILKQRGWGSSVAKEDLDKLGIPVVGKEAKAQAYKRIPGKMSTEDLVAKAKIAPDEVSTALDGINKRLTKLERSVGRGSSEFQKWSVIKNQFQNLLEVTAPGVKEANKEFSRVALRDKFMEPLPVNQAGTMSKIGAFGFTPLAATGGAVLAGGPGALIAGGLAQAARSPFLAGLSTAARGLVDKLIDPGLSRVATGLSRRGLITAYVTRRRQEDQQ